ncbi:hypothetical protein [Parachitinimonas caeni]|uniref:Uncharacterized protein n=1 Tax=Parachitinimonas caeni TaxID=3031301 RepID=A0ABT7DVN2_9NEIS|nr:hypothetical protein [Parachitinimonas caeni]MDK2123894.1 hypothetical protein [Parachitinimonas caeni]
MQKVENKELDLRNLEIVTEVTEKAAGNDTEESFEIWTITAGSSIHN